MRPSSTRGHVGDSSTGDHRHHPFVATALTGCSSKPQASPPRSGSVWVADEGHDSVSVIDAATNTVTMTLTGIKGPHNIQVGRDDSVVYAVSSAGIVVAIDPATYRVTATAPTGPHPAHVIEAPTAGST